MQLRQLFLNLIRNALKFKNPDGVPVVYITSQIILGSKLPPSVNIARAVSMYHQITVADNGIGFNQQHADRIFQLLQCLHGRSQYVSTGISLAICERVAANHGGVISVSSEPDRGALFTILFACYLTITNVMVVLPLIPR